MFNIKSHHQNVVFQVVVIAWRILNNHILKELGTNFVLQTQIQQI